MIKMSHRQVLGENYGTNLVDKVISTAKSPTGVVGGTLGGIGGYFAGSKLGEIVANLVPADPSWIPSMAEGIQSEVYSQNGAKICATLGIVLGATALGYISNKIKKTYFSN